jgi:hypothetical protein
MKRTTLFVSILFVLFALTVSACAPKTTAAGDILTVSQGDTSVTYTADDLQALGEVQATFKDVTYVGVPLSVLLQDAGFDPQTLQAVKVVAVDGYSVNYDPATFLAQDTLVSWARADGPLGDDEVPFRMVLPNAEGKMNVRQITEIQAIP